MIFPLIRIYEQSFQTYHLYQDAPTKNLIDIFTKANINNQKEIFLTKNDIVRYKLTYIGIGNDAFSYPNYNITYWMQMYNVVDKPITIRVIDKEK